MDSASGKQGWNIEARSFQPRLMNDIQSEENYNQSQENYNQTQTDYRSNSAGSAQFTKSNDNSFMPYYINGNNSIDLIAQLNNLSLSPQYDLGQYMYLQSLATSMLSPMNGHRVQGSNKSINPYLQPYINPYNRVNQSTLMTMPYVVQAQSPTVTNAAGRSKRNSCTVNKIFNTGDPQIDQHLTESYKRINPRSVFDRDLSNSRFFVIKSYTEEHVHRSIKYGEWCSTPRGNEVLDQAYRSVQVRGGRVYLFFSVNSSGYFCGVAEMASECDGTGGSRSGHWTEDKWRGGFLVEWLYVKDVPNKYLKHIVLEYNDNRPITNSRDATEMRPAQKGHETLRLMHEYHHNSSLFDDFEYYESRERQSLGHSVCTERPSCRAYCPAVYILSCLSVCLIVHPDRPGRPRLPTTWRHQALLHRGALSAHFH